MKLTREFYLNSSLELAQLLLGKVICIKINNEIKKFRIVETECYGGAIDKASHSYNNKRTKRTEVMFNIGGYVYVYLIYGMYYCLNIVANDINIPEAVLIRAVEPLDDIAVKTNGPGKLCKTLEINSRHNGLDLCSSEDMYIIADNYQVLDIVCTKRINIDYAGEDKEKLWRFYIKDNRYISKK